MNLKKIGKVFTSKSVGTGPSSYVKGIYRAAVSQRLRNTAPGKYLIICLPAWREKTSNRTDGKRKRIEGQNLWLQRSAKGRFTVVILYDRFGWITESELNGRKKFSLYYSLKMNRTINVKMALTVTACLGINVLGIVYLLKDEAQTALFKDPVRTAL